MAYTLIGWLNDQAPAINKTNLNKMDNGIFNNDAKSQDIITYSQRKEVNSLVNTAGAIMYSNGADTNGSSALSSYRRSDYIPVSVGDIITFAGVRNYSTYATLAFYDSNKTYDQTRSIAGTGANNQYAYVVIDKDGYIRLNGRNTELDSYSVFRLTNKIGNGFNNRTEQSFLKQMLDAGQYLVFTDESKWMNGTTDSSIVINSNTTYRITTSSTIVFPEETTIYIKDGFRIYTYFVNENDERITAWSWKTGTIRIPAGSRCRFIIGRVTEDTSEHLPLDVIYNFTTDLGFIKKFNELPDYWRSYLEVKYPTLWGKDAEAGNGDSFIFVTDIHYERNILNSPGLIKDILGKTAVNKVFCGGDMFDLEDTKEEAFAKLEKWESLMAGTKHFNIVGNHDGNNYNSSQSDKALTESELYGIMTKPAEQWINTNGKLYFVVDNESQKIRYICLAIEVFDQIGDSGEQHDWFQEKLTEKGSDWTILVIQHRIWGSTLEAIDTKAQKVINAINAVYSNIQAKFIGIIAGHTHTDNDITESVNGYLLIATNCDANVGTSSGYTRTAGTTSEQSFDVFYIDKANEKLYAVRIGAGDTVVGSGKGIQSWNY
jgi:hypothetical protein